MNLEGIVAKRADSRYVAGRSHAWLKIKTSAAEGRERESERLSVVVFLLQCRDDEFTLVDEALAFVAQGKAVLRAHPEQAWVEKYVYDWPATIILTGRIASPNNVTWP